MSDYPNVFLSYSHSDKEFAHKMAKDLRKSGVDLWIDKWEIQPGDSLVQKIFLEGLENTEFILILLSEESTKSKWVTEELNVAIIKRLNDSTRVIPLILGSVNIPLPLKGLFWIDMSLNYEEGLRELVKTFHGVSEKPPIGKIPEYVTSLKNSVGGLSKNATTVGSLMLSRPDEQTGCEKIYLTAKLRELVPYITNDDFEDAIDELNEYGLIKGISYGLNRISPTYKLLLLLKEECLSYDPEEDIKAVAAAVTAKSQINGDELQNSLKLSPLRLNHAIDYLEDYKHINVIRTLGTAPYHFRTAIATRHTRRFVEENCR